MRVILQKDVAGIGRKYDVKDVASGHAQNLLIPKGLAKVATPEAMKKVEALKAGAEAERKVQENLLEKNLHEIEGREVPIKAKANDKGHLFAALHPQEISNAIKVSIGADIHPDFIILEKHIKETGPHNIEIKAGEKSAKIKLVVEAE